MPRRTRDRRRAKRYFNDQRRRREEAQAQRSVPAQKTYQRMALDLVRRGLVSTAVLGPRGPSHAPSDHHPAT